MVKLLTQLSGIHLKTPGDTPSGPLALLDFNPFIASITSFTEMGSSNTGTVILVVTKSGSNGSRLLGFNRCSKCSLKALSGGCDSAGSSKVPSIVDYFSDLGNYKHL